MLNNANLPYITVFGQGTNPEESVSVDLVATTNGIQFSEEDLIALVRQHLDSLPGVGSTSATRYRVAVEQIGEGA
ncbi:hypothetical protein ACWGLG_16520 [Streptomyces antimycoticus]